MKAEIEVALRNLVGAKLTRTRRESDMECLQFGDKQVVTQEGELLEVGEFAIHIQCGWRFVNNKSILVGSQDLYEPEDESVEYDENFDWEEKNLRDKKLNKLIHEKELIVQSIKADVYGGAELKFSDQIKLQIFPAFSKVDEYSEFWRLLDNRIESKRHIIVGGAGVEELE